MMCQPPEGPGFIDIRLTHVVDLDRVSLLSGDWAVLRFVSDVNLELSRGLL